MNLESLTSLLSSKRHVKHFLNEPIAHEVIGSLIDCARLAPSTCNLQPTHFYILQGDAKERKSIVRACMGNHRFEEAPLIVVFSGDRRVIPHHLEQVIDDEWKNDSFSVEDEERLRLYTKMNFDQGFGIAWIAKVIASPILRLLTPLPLLPAVHKRYWLTKEVMMTASHFLIAAEAAGFSTYSVDIFDEWRVRHALNIPWSHIVPVIIAVGRPAELSEESHKLPQSSVVHWQN